jgi:hypothetical protein
MRNANPSVLEMEEDKLVLKLVDVNSKEKLKFYSLNAMKNVKISVLEMEVDKLVLKLVDANIPLFKL